MRSAVKMFVFVVILASAITLAMTCGNPQTRCDFNKDMDSIDCSAAEAVISCLMKESEGCEDHIISTAQEIISSILSQHSDCNFSGISHGIQIRSSTIAILLVVPMAIVNQMSY